MITRGEFKNRASTEEGVLKTEKEELISHEFIPKAEIVLEYSIDQPVITLINFLNFLSQF